MQTLERTVKLSSDGLFKQHKLNTSMQAGQAHPVCLVHELEPELPVRKQPDTTPWPVLRRNVTDLTAHSLGIVAGKCLMHHCKPAMYKSTQALSKQEQKTHLEGTQSLSISCCMIFLECRLAAR